MHPHEEHMSRMPRRMMESLGEFHSTDSEKNRKVDIKSFEFHSIDSERNRRVDLKFFELDSNKKQFCLFSRNFTLQNFCAHLNLLSRTEVIYLKLTRFKNDFILKKDKRAVTDMNKSLKKINIM